MMANDFLAAVPDGVALGHIGLLLPAPPEVACQQLRAVLPAALTLSGEWFRPDAGKAAPAGPGMRPAIESAAQRLVSEGADLMVLCGTTALADGSGWEEVLLGHITAATGLPSVSTTQALMAALRAVDARRVVVLSPHQRLQHEAEVEAFRQCGFETVGGAGYDCRSPVEMPQVAAEAWHAFALDHADDRADAYVLSATAAPTLAAAARLETALDRPVITSHAAVARWCARRFGLPIHPPMSAQTALAPGGLPAAA